MTSFPFRIVGFDLDGTLVDSAADLAAAVNATLAEAGRPSLPVDEVRALMGGGARRTLTQAMAATGGSTDAELDRLYARLLDHYQTHIAILTRPYPGAIEAVDALRAMGVRCAIVTNKLEGLAAQLLDMLGIGDRFDCLIGGDTMGPGNAKPSPTPILAMIERCGGGPTAFVGDTAYDTMAARAAGIPSIAVSFGFTTDRIEELGADAVITAYDELIPALRRLPVRPAPVA